jgi:hypothetical protein
MAPSSAENDEFNLKLILFIFNILLIDGICPCTGMPETRNKPGNHKESAAFESAVPRINGGYQGASTAALNAMVTGVRGRSGLRWKR